MRRLQFLDLLLRRGNELGRDLTDGDEGASFLRSSLVWLLALGSLYGFAMGSYNGLLGQSWLYALSSAVKLPLLMLGTTLLCFPALYVFGVAGGASIRPRALLSALLSAQAVLVLALVALIPVVLFFSTTIHAYRVVKLMHVGVFLVAGLLSLRFLAGVLRLADAKLVKNRKLVLSWMLLFCLTGAQMGWMMRPFIGRKGETFELTRNARGSIFQDVPRTVAELLRLPRRAPDEG